MVELSILSGKNDHNIQWHFFHIDENVNIFIFIALIIYRIGEGIQLSIQYS